MAARAEETRTMRKRLVVFCDGTWNSADKPAVTNVCKLCNAVDRAEDAAVPQIVKYEPGVGTRRWEKIRGGAFGVGLSRNVRECYEFLVDNYEPGDELFFFGFSRGAFTARSLGGLVRNSGILLAEHRGMVKDAYKLYRSPKRDDAPSAKAAKDFRDRYSHPDAEITFIGVWDTVGALGIPLRGLRWFTKKDEQFHDVQLSRSVEHAFHALAVDEHRAPFRPTLWLTRDENQDVQQVWFAGAHSDVGGGYAETGLSDIALQWMIDRAKGVGLAFDEEAMKARPLRPDPKMGAHDSRTAFYRVARGVEREIGSGPVDPTKPEDSAKQRDSTQSLHESVLQRWRECPDWRPPAVAKFLEGNPGGGEIPAKLAPVG